MMKVQNTSTDNSKYYLLPNKSRANSLQDNSKMAELKINQLTVEAGNPNCYPDQGSLFKIPITLGGALNRVKSIYSNADNPIRLNCYEKIINRLCFPYCSKEYRQFSQVTQHFEGNIRDAIVQRNLGEKVNYLLQFIKKLVDPNQEKYYIESFFDNSQSDKNAITVIKHLSVEIDTILNLPCSRGLDWETNGSRNSVVNEIQANRFLEEYETEVKALKTNYIDKISLQLANRNSHEIFEKKYQEVDEQLSRYTEKFTEFLLTISCNDDHFSIKEELKEKNNTVKNLKYLKEHFEKLKRNFETLKSNHDEYLTKYNYFCAPVSLISNSSIACILSVVTLTEELLNDESSIAQMRRGSHIIKIFLTLIACCAALSNQSNSFARCNVQSQRLKYMVDALENITLEIDKKWNECDRLAHEKKD